MNNDDIDPISAIFGLPTTTDSPFVETPKVNVRGNKILDPQTGEMIERSTESLDEIEIAKEERIEDIHIDAQLENIHNMAMSAFESQHRMSQEVDPKFSARNSEVAAQYLNIALGAVKDRVDAKYKRQKIKIAQKTTEPPKSGDVNVFVGNRNDLLKALRQEKEVDPDFKEEK